MSYMLIPLVILLGVLLTVGIGLIADAGIRLLTSRR